MFPRIPRLLACAVLMSASSLCFAVPTITFGPLGGGLNDGTTPFGSAQIDASGNLIPCASAADTDIDGADCGENNRIVRNQDIANHLWSIAVSGGDPLIPAGDPVLTDVVIEQTIHPSTNAVVNFTGIPTACTVIAGAGINPPSSIVENADGSTTLTCNLGEFAEGQARLFTVPVQPSGESWNGSSYTTTQRVYSLDASGNSNATSVPYEDNTPVMISASPAYDLIHSLSPTHSIRNYSVTTRDVGQGLETGFLAYMHIRLAANRPTGIESITQPLTINNTFTATKDSSAGPTFPLEFYVVECRPNPSGWSAETFGKETYDSTRPITKKVVDSGDCVYTRDDPNDPTSTSFSVELSNADLNGSRYPTSTVGGTDLSAGPYYVINHRVTIFIPSRSVDLTDGIAGNGTGSVYLSSILNDFDPDSPSGTSNYGSETEPGYNGELIDGLKSNNQLSPTEFKLITRGSFSKRNLRTVNDSVGSSSSYTYTAAGSYHAGDGEVHSGESTAGWIYVVNTGTSTLNNPNACDIFDNTVQQLTDRGDVGATSGTYAYMGTYAPGGHDYTDYDIEYANIDLTGDDPLDNNNDGTRDYNVVTGRYDGDWTNIRAARCDDASATNGWHTNPDDVAGGIDGVNAARAILSPAAIAAGKGFTPAQEIRFVIPLKARDKFLGGPYDGESIPVGTVLPNFGGFKSDEYSSNWTARSYVPAPENGSVDGDRVTLSRLTIALDSHSITPYAAPGQTASTIAGYQVVWQVDTAIQTTLSPADDAQNFTIINELPPEVSYNSSCTAATAGGTPAGIVQYNTDRNGNPAPGYTLLTWNLGDLPANVAVPPRIICTDSDPLALDGTSVVNYAEARADNVISSLAVRADTHAVQLSQIGEVQLSKTVDVPLDDQNDEQVYHLAWVNFSAALSIAAPVMIDIFPYNGDSNSPPSNFTSALALANAPVTTWSDGSVPLSGEAPIGVWYYTSDAPNTIISDPDNNISNWCLESQFNTGVTGCPTDLGSTTAVKFVANYDLERDGNVRQGMKTVITLNAGTSADPSSANNSAGDVYTNNFTVDSATLPADQYLTSPNASVRVPSFTVGDLVFADIDGDGKYNPDVDFTAPDGVIINLYGSDGTFVETTTTGLEQPGRFIFYKQSTGDYYIEIPASEFQDTKALESWIPSLLINTANDDINEADDQDAYTVGSPAIDGIRSGIISLTANFASEGGIPTGNEPIGDNTGVVTDPTAAGDDFTNYTLDMGLIPDLYNISGTVWNDANNNGIREPSESGIPGVTVVLAGAPYPGVAIRCTSINTDANGFYQFESMMSGDYQIIESDASSSPFGSAVCPPADSDPATYLSTTPNVRNVTLYETDLTRQDFGDYNGVFIRGTVFDDNGIGGAISANENQESTELGIAGIKVIVTDASGNVYDSTVTATDGSYELQVPASAVGSTVNVVETNGNDYVTTGAQVGDSSGSYNASTDTISFTIDPATTYTGLDFGDVKKPIFEPNNTGEILPGNVIFYNHTFTTPASGKVVFSHASDLNTSTSWANLLYRDTDCDGTLNAAEASAALGTTAINVNAGDKVCIINKVYAPSNVAARDQHRVTINANFNYGGSAVGEIDIVTTDVTTAGQVVAPSTPATDAVTAAPAEPSAPAVDATPTTPATPATDATPAQPAVAATPVTAELGPSRLELRKSVQNTTQNTAETEVSNEAAPGDVLKYRIYYSNTGTGPITDLKINDSAPAYTEFKSGSGSCAGTPSGMTCTPIMGIDAIEWRFTGTLVGGEDGSVSYEVIIND